MVDDVDIIVSSPDVLVVVSSSPVVVDVDVDVDVLSSPLVVEDDDASPEEEDVSPDDELSPDDDDESSLPDEESPLDDAAESSEGLPVESHPPTAKRTAIMRGLAEVTQLRCFWKPKPEVKLVIIATTVTGWIVEINWETERCVPPQEPTNESRAKTLSPRA